MTGTRTVGITGRALVSRLRRKLAQRQETLLWDRGGKLGYYVVSLNRNAVMAQNCNLMELALEMDCIRPWERLEDE